MRKRDEVRDPKSCLNKARDDEWLFILLSRDTAAPVAVEAWIKERIRLGKNADDDPQILEARQWVAAVRDGQTRQAIAPEHREGAGHPGGSE